MYIHTRSSLIEKSPPKYDISLVPVLVLSHLSVPHPGATHQQELCTLYVSLFGMQGWIPVYIILS